MARNESYSGTIDLIAGLRPKNGGAFPLMDAIDVQTREDGTRLDAELTLLWAAIAQIREQIAGGIVVPSEELSVSEIEELLVSGMEIKTVSEVEA